MLDLFALDTNILYSSEGSVFSWHIVRSVPVWALPLSSLQGLCTVMSLTWPSSKYRKTIVWKSSRGSGGTVASVQKRRTTVPKVCLWLMFICLTCVFNVFNFLLSPLSCNVHFSYHTCLSPGLGMENIGGIFVVLVCGLLVAIFMAVLEFVWMLRQAPGNEVREGYLTCICFVSLSPPWHPPPRGAAMLPHSAQLWQEVYHASRSSFGFNVTLTLPLSRLGDIISTKPKIYLT